MTDTPNDGGPAWTSYAERRPDAAGAYEWRVPSVAVKGAILRFVANMRLRGAGGETVLSPMFDHWDGYRIHVPAGTEWRSLTDAPKIRDCDVLNLTVEELTPCDCPFCHTTPGWKAYEQSSGFSGGFIVAADPQNYNYWQLECCAWTKTPAYRDPRELVAARDSMLAERAKVKP